jgi:tetratricopeptide (TPR) repeat protein
VALMGLGKLDDALEALDRAIKLNPAFVVAHKARAATLIALARNDEAKVSLDRANEIEAAAKVQPGATTN